MYLLCGIWVKFWISGLGPVWVLLSIRDRYRTLLGPLRTCCALPAITYRMKHPFPRSLFSIKRGKHEKKTSRFSDFWVFWWFSIGNPYFLNVDIVLGFGHFSAFWPENDCSGGARCHPRESRESRVPSKTIVESAQNVQNSPSNVP